MHIAFEAYRFIGVLCLAFCSLAFAHQNLYTVSLKENKNIHSCEVLNQTIVSLFGK